MSFDEHLTEFAGLPVAAFTPNTEPGETLPPAGEVAWAVRGDWNDDEPYPDLFERFMAAVDTTRVTALVIGFWGWDDALGQAQGAPSQPWQDWEGLMYVQVTE